MKISRGFSLIELLTVIIIFAVVMAGLYAAYSVQVRQGMQQYKLAESEMELEITKSILERDILMAGYGIADTYCTAPATDVSCPSGLRCNDTGLGFCVPVPISATNGSPDTMALMGTGLGMGSRATGGWTYTLSATPAAETDYKNWTHASYAVDKDAREKPKTGDRIIYIEPNIRKLMIASGGDNTGGSDKSWMFVYPPSGSANTIPDLPDPGVLVFGLNTDNASTNFPYYTVGYHLSTSGTGLATCAPGTENLLRLESRSVEDPSTAGNPILNCVLDMQVAFGLDTDEDGDLDCWDNGGSDASGYNNNTLRARLKLVKMFVLVQEGDRDEGYLFSNPDPTYALNPDKIRVGDSILTACGGGAVGQEVTLTAGQRKYRWRVVSLSLAPRNMR